ncbi:MAG: DUF1592 domain-containing protein [Polyangiales bacterium]
MRRRRSNRSLVSFVGVLTVVFAACTGAIGDPAGESILPPIPGSTVFEPLSPVVRRLTRDEYAQTLADVVGVTLTGTQLASIPEDRPLEGFAHIASAQTVLPEHVLAYNDLARVATSDAAFPAFVARHSECTETTTACGSAFILQAGGALFRRPMAAEDAMPFETLFAAMLAEEADYSEAVAAVTQAMLQSPGFIYLLQREREPTSSSADEDVRIIGGYEMASKLSYFLWGAPPDEELYEAAASGRLDTADGVEAEAMRMLGESARVRRSVARYLIDWARLESLPDEDGLKDDLIASAVEYYVDRVENDANLFSLFSDQDVFLTPRLAEAYGEDASDGVLVVQREEGGGILGQPGVVAGMTNADGGEIVARGLFLLSQLFCGNPPNFPVELQGAIDEFVAGQPEDASDRDIAEARLERSECGNCHRSFDPLAYAFERFDHRGLPRTEDEHGNALRVDGWIPQGLHSESGEQTYDGFASYMLLLNGNSRIRACLAQKQVEFAIASRVGLEQQGAVTDLVAAVTDSSTHRAMVRTLVRHDVFRTMERAQ